MASATLVDLLVLQAERFGNKPLYVFLDENGGEQNRRSFAQLDARARAIAAFLRESCPPGSRVLLLFPPGIEYIEAFFGCLYAGVIAVPAYPPDPTRPERTLGRLLNIIEDADAQVVLTVGWIRSLASHLAKGFPALLERTWIATDTLPDDVSHAWQRPELRPETVAFLQYTSGSTGNPKGVVLTHANLLANEAMIQTAFGNDSDTRAVGWLPLYHDMGLIGNVLQPLFVGGECILMSPLTFLANPYRWLEAITRHKANTSGGPNFAYDLCVRKVTAEQRETLDLSSWRLAFCGAEPVRAESLRRFASTFAWQGFQPRAFYPCYGLAEATLLVSGSSRSSAPPVVSVDAKALEEHRVVYSDDAGARRAELVGCGASASGQMLRIVDPESHRIVADGVVGEIWVAGPHVARGYWNRAEESAAVFEARVEGSDEGPFLRTGDLGFLRDGELFITGRRKDLIILRGRNLYPQDIELAVERASRAVRPGCTAAFSVEVEREERLVVVAEARGADASELAQALRDIRRAISESFEASVFGICLLRPGTLPKTSSGKVQRRESRSQFLGGALQILADWRQGAATDELDSQADESSASAQSEAEPADPLALLREMVAQRCRVPLAEVAGDTSLAALGVDSMTAVELQHGVHERFGVNLPLSNFLGDSSLATLLQQISHAHTSNTSSELQVRETQALSVGQRALLFFQEISPASSAYNLSAAVQVEAELDVRALECALEQLAARHPLLRSKVGASEDGPIWVDVDGALGVERRDATGSSDDQFLAALEAEANRPFSLSQGPLLRMTVFTRAGMPTVLLVCAHHIIADLWSLSLFAKELGELYDAVCLGSVPEAKPQAHGYGLFAGWQEQLLASSEGERMLAFWAKELERPVPVLDLPSDRPRPALQTFHGGTCRSRLPSGIVSTVSELARKHNTTLYGVLLAAYEVLLALESGLQHFGVGVTTTTRSRAELAPVIGYLVNPVCVRAELVGNPSFDELLPMVRDRLIAALSNKDIPFPLLIERLHPDREPSRHPLFQTLFTLEQSTDESHGLNALALGLPGVAFSIGSLPVRTLALRPGGAQMDLSLTLATIEGELWASLEYNADLFDADTAERILVKYAAVVEAITKNPEIRVLEMDLANATERESLARWSVGPTPLAAIPDPLARFEAHAASRPGAVAVEDGHLRLTYGEVDARASHLARELRALGVGPESVVGLGFERSALEIIGLVAILKAGAAFLPLDVSLPHERIGWLLEEAAPKVVLTPARHASLWPQTLYVLALDGADGTATVKAGVAAAREDLAYILYTSGTTGRPKGVMVTRGALANVVDDAIRNFELHEGSRVCCISSLSFDATILESVACLAAGGVLFVPSTETVLHGPSLGEFLRTHAIDTLDTTPTVLATIPPQTCTTVQTIVVGGESLASDLVRVYAPGRRMLNCYGPTETTVQVTLGEVLPDKPITIGKPLQGVRCHVLDANFRPVPPGTPGELFVGGDCLARGYLRDPALTAARFVPDPWSPGARLYRTGDRVRWTATGDLQFLGRMDRQIKLRGVRIELEEIEAAFSESGLVEDVAVLVDAGRAGGRLVAFVVAKGWGPPQEAALRSFIEARLVATAIPTIVPIERLPVTASGKVDQAALLVHVPSRSEHVEARTSAERAVAEVFASAFGVDRVGAHDDFFALGGHSLLAMQVVFALRERFERDVPLSVLFTARSVDRIAAALEELHEQAELPVLAPGVAGDEHLAPASFAQQRLWFVHQLDQGSSAYHLGEAIALRGALDVAALERAVTELVIRHESLRTTFEEVDGLPMQVVHPAPLLGLQQLDLSGHLPAHGDAALRQWVHGELSRPLDLRTGPLFKATLVRLADQHHALVLVMHHIIVDGWSLDVMAADLARFYAAYARDVAPDPTTGVSYRDFTVWQRELLDEHRLASSIEYWRTQLDGATTTLSLPHDHHRPAVQTFRSGRVQFTLSEGVKAGLESEARRSDGTLYSVLLASFGALLSRYSGQDDLVVGVPMANRTRRELERVVGFFVNTLPLRIQVDGNPSFSELARQVSGTMMAAQVHQDVPLERLIADLRPERDSSHSSLFQVVFSMEPKAFDLELAGVEAKPMHIERPSTAFDLALFASEHDHGIFFELEYSLDLFEPQTIERLASHLQCICEAVAKSGAAGVLQLPLLSTREREQLLSWGTAEAEFPRDALLHELFEAQVKERPDALALRSGDELLTYAELDGRANVLAHRLREQGIGPDSCVGVLLERSIDLIVALLGILKAGGAYVPLDVELPEERLLLLRQEAQVRVIVTRAGLAPKLPGDAARVLVDDMGPAVAVAVERSAATSDNLAYVLFTSGSTGVPKGVCVTHRAVARLVKNAGFANLDASQTFLQLAPVSFDASTLEIWGALLNGATLVIAPAGALSLDELGGIVRREGVSILWLTAGLFHEMVKSNLDDLRGVRQLLAGGDVVSAHHVREVLRAHPGCTVINGYGPTETTTFACCHPVAREADVTHPLPIGRPIGNTSVYVLDDNLELVPVGIRGQLFIGGEGLARGYLGRPDLTAEKFIADPFGAPGARMYATGDIVRWRNDGALEFLGRRDAQVKVRGFRVEPGELEATLLLHPELEQAAVVVHDTPRGKTLTAYVAGLPGQPAPNLRVLREFVASRLPAYMMPGHFVRMDALPLTPNGKVDRRALPLPNVEDLPQGDDIESPLQPQEELVAQLFAEILGLARVGRDANFFELGGHSLLATQLISRIRQTFGVEVPLRALFESPTVAGLSIHVQEALWKKHSLAIPPLVPRESSSDVPLSFAQERLWFLDQWGSGSSYNIAASVKLTGTLREDSLRAALRELVQRHEALRTCFIDVDGRPMQHVGEPRDVPLVVEDWTSLSDERRSAEVSRATAEEASRRFSLECGPLLHARLLRFAPQEQLLLLTIHHIVADGWSIGVMVRELSSFYAAHAQGRPLELPALPVQYPDFAQWQRAWLEGPTLAAQLAFWRAHLEGAPAFLSLPTDYPRPAEQSFRGACDRRFVPARTTDALTSVARSENATRFMAFLAAFDTLLMRYSGETDLVVGTAIANRNHAGIEGLIGFFVNKLALRVNVSGNPTFRELLQRVRDVSLDGFVHQDLPFEKLVAELDPTRNLNQTPLFQVSFVYQNAPKSEVALPGLDVEVVENDTHTAKFDLTLFVDELPEGLRTTLEYSTDLWAPSSIERMHEQLHRLLDAAAKNPDARIGELPLLDVRARAEVLTAACGPRVERPTVAGIHALFEARAAQTPDRIAVEYHDERTTYGELDRWSNQIARRLRREGVGAEQVVGVYCERSTSAVAAILGVLKAGAAYLPLDPEYPEERLRLMIEDAGARYLLTSPELVQRLPQGTGAESLELSRAAFENEDVTAVPPQQRASRLAYVIYTSGSSGRPKGVMVEHEAVVNHMLWRQGAYPLLPDDGFLQKASLGFDISVWELFAPLIAGAKMVIAAAGVPRDPAALRDLIARHRVTVAHAGPAALAALLDTPTSASIASLRQVFCGGEPLTAELAARFHQQLPHATLHHQYGPTETCIDVACWDCLPGAEGTLPIGKGIDNVRLHVLDERMQPVPFGVLGELYVGGAALARGYLGSEELTAARFVPDPFAEEITGSFAASSGRLYRTGDKVRCLPDGNIEFHGRVDRQVKLRGYRIELQEIEAALEGYPAVQHAAAIVREDIPGDRRLVGYVVPSEQWQRVSPHAVEEYVSQWQSFYDENYSERALDEDPTFDIAGWKSSYTGERLAVEDMREWVDTTVERIAAFGPKRVLEMGCGTGLLLFRLAGTCERYVGADFSPHAVEHIRRHLPSVVRHPERVELFERRADDYSGFGDGTFDAVVINSVAQYFPSVDYLTTVLEDAVRVTAPGGVVFAGDIRSFPLLETFHASVQAAQSNPDLSLEELGERVEQHLAMEKELVVAPGYFETLASRLSRVGHVQVLLKRGDCDNELTRFRYDVVFHVRGEASLPLFTPSLWLEWDRQGYSLQRLEQALHEQRPSSLAFRRIPNARLHGEHGWSRMFAEREAGMNVSEARARLALQSRGVDPEELVRLALRYGYRVELSWLSSGLDGAFDACFTPLSEPEHLTVFASATARKQATGASQHANNPMQGHFERTLAPELRKYLVARLPEHAVPSAIVMLPSLPLGTTGKVDHGALPAPKRNRGERSDAAELPRNEVEQALAGVWSEVLGVDHVGIHENFFELGGHSLLATQVAARVRQLFRVELPVRRVFEMPTVAELATALGSKVASASGSLEIERRASEGPIVTSYAQERLWFLDQLDPMSAAYNVPAALRIEGPLDLELLRRAFEAVVHRHEALRTTFDEVEGQPVQRIASPTRVELPLQYLDDREASPEALVRRVAAEEALKPFDLRRGPLYRVSLLQVAPNDHVLLVTLHHIVSDGWSLQVLVREVCAAYAAYAAQKPAPLPELPIQYADFAQWQRQELAGEALAKQVAFWKQHLNGAPPHIELPVDYPYPAQPSSKGAQYSVVQRGEEERALRSFCQREGVTPFMALLAGYALLLTRYCGEGDVVVGSPIAGRTRVELEPLIGFFANTLALRVQVEPDLTVRSLMRQVRETVLSAQAHADLPFEKLVEELRPVRDLRRNAIFQVMLAYQEYDASALALPGLRVSPVDADRGTAKFDLLLAVTETGGGLRTTFEYRTDLFAPQTIERMADHLRTLMAEMFANPDLQVSQLQMVTGQERETLLSAWNATDESFPDASLVELFEAQASKRPDSVAVQLGTDALSYAELNARANQLANLLASLGVGPEARVAICLERSLELLVSVWGVWKAGAAYVPLEPEYPADRLAYMLESARPDVVLTTRALAAAHPELAGTVLAFEDIATKLDAQSADQRPRLAEASGLAYVIYTSGSTGRPKGAMNSHRAIHNRILWMQKAYPLGAEDCVLHKTPIGFDVSVWELFWPFITGARLVLARPGDHKDPAALADLIEREQITTLHFVPPMLESFLEQPNLRHRCRSLRRVLCSGEALPRAVVNAFFERVDAELHNLYGPTEAAVDVTAAQCWPGASDEVVPIGRPISNTRVYVLDATLQPVPVGVAGELYIGGVAVGRGYFRRPDLTAERFVPDPFDEGGGRLYRTGDRVRRNAEGVIEYLGRLDHQVKLRGFRIELGEIESVLREHEGVGETIVLLQGSGASAQLVAFFVAKIQPAPAASALQAFLRGRLPEYMVPSRVLAVDAFPLTPNGKTDRQALLDHPGLAVSPTSEAPGAAATTPLEELLVAIWSDVLGVASVGIEQDFFAIGGHSLLATQVVSRVREKLGRDIPLRAMFEAPTVRALARAIEALHEDPAARLPPLQRIADGDPAPLSFSQQRLWLLDQLEGRSATYNNVTAVRVTGALRVDVLQRCLDAIVERHEVLRTHFASSDGTPHQVVDAAGRAAVERLPVANAEELHRRASALAATPFDLERGPLLRIAVFELAADEHVLLLVMHHIISDEWSMSIFVREVAALYGAFLHGEASPLPELSIQYGDYARWQHRWMAQPHVADGQLAYWREQLRGVPVLQLPTDKARPPLPSHRAGRVHGRLSPEVMQQVRELGRHEGVTPFMTLLAVFNLLMARHSGQQDIAIGSPVANRRMLEAEALIGFFVNMVTLRTHVGGQNGGPSFRELLGRVREVTLGAYAHQDLPFERVVEALQPARQLGHTPLFQVAFALQNTPPMALDVSGLEFAPLSVGESTARFDLTFVLTESEGGLDANIVYSADLFEEATVKRMWAHFEQLLASALASPDRAVGHLDMLTASELEALEQWSGSWDPGWQGPCLPALFEAQVDRSPDAVAVCCRGTTLTYRELDERANAVAHYLRELGVGPETIVALYLDRTPELLVGMLAIAKAGGAYLPIDPTQPAMRVAFMLEDAKARILVSSEDLRDAVPEVGAFVVSLDDPYAMFDGSRVERPALTTEPSHLAYVIYTSGSTGQPKGSLITHGGLSNYLLWAAEAYGAGEGAGSPVHSSISFDLTVTSLFTPLVVGRAVELIPASSGLEGLGQALLEHEDDPFALVKLTPAHLELLSHQLGSRVGGTRTLVVGGEALYGRLLSRWTEHAPDTWVVNEYGPTEAVVGCCIERVRAGDLAPGAVSIGRPIANTMLHVLDDALQRVPVGVPGELYIGGAGVARGYLNRPDLTVQSFVPDPFSGVPGARLYRTHDRVKWLPDGRLEFLGRTDNQVKVRGYRVELGEIEAAVAEHPGIEEAVVIAQQRSEGDRRLVAYVVPSGVAAPAKVLARLDREGALEGLQVREFPEQLPIVFRNTNETEYIYQEIFHDGVYARHGITIRDGDCIFDVGANVGMFSMFAARQARNVKLYCFEPIPATFHLLRCNTSVNGLDATLFNCGVAEKEGEATFTYYPHASVLSGRFADATDAGAVRAAVTHEGPGGAGLGDISKARLEDLIEERLRGEEVHCKLLPLSDVIAEHGIERIDLLKVDAERSELEVLMGLTEEDWAKIRQIAIEVHASEGRLERITAMLEDHGFAVVAEQDDILKTTDIFNLYARRTDVESNADDRIRPTASVEARCAFATREALVQDLRASLDRRLPEHMVPQVMMVLDRMPLTENGKVDRDALPEPEESTSAERVAPRTDQEHALAELWRDVLGVEQVGVTDNFFDLGGHSFLAVRLMAEIEKRFGINLPLSAVFRAPTVEQLAGELQQPVESRWSPVVTLTEGTDEVPLFLVHPVGGNVACYRELARALGPKQPLYGLEAQGLDGQRQPISRIEDMAALYVEALRHKQSRGPFRLGGWSLGGTIALEMARQLRDAGETVQQLVLIDAVAPRLLSPVASNPKPLDIFGRLLGNELLDRLPMPASEFRALAEDTQLQFVQDVVAELGLTAHGVSTERLEHWMNVFNANEIAVRAYTPPAYDGAVLLVRADGGAYAQCGDAALGWCADDLPALDVRSLAGDHYSILGSSRDGGQVDALARLIAHLDEVARELVEQ